MSTLRIGKFKITAHAHDHAGMYGKLHGDNSVSVSRTVTVRDTTRPDVHIDGVQPARVECTHSYNDAGARCSDNLDTPLGLTIPVWNMTTVTDKALKTVGDYAVSYGCTDSHGLDAIVAKRLVRVRDATPPAVSWTPDAGSTITHYSKEGNDLTDPGIMCDDTCDKKEKQIQVEWVGPAFTDMLLGTYKRKYTCFDESGNKASIIRDFVVVDKDAPTIKLHGDDPLTLEATQQGYQDAGADCTDYTNGILNAHWDNDDVNMRVPGTYKVTFTCSDHSGNGAPARLRTVVVKDTTCPKLELNLVKSSQEEHIEASFPFIDEGASAFDTLDGDISSKIWTSGDSVDVERSFMTRRSCADIKAHYAAANTAQYFISVKNGNSWARVKVWCDFQGGRTGTYFPVKEASESIVPYGSVQGECGKHGLVMASFVDAAAKASAHLQYCGQQQGECNYFPVGQGAKTNFYLCSVAKDTDVSEVHVHHGMSFKLVTNAQKGKYVIAYHVKDEAGNAECENQNQNER
eukprot:g7117.t1